MEIKLAIFDMDGLIFDSERAFERELKEVMHSYGYKLTEDIYKSTIGLTGQKLKEKMEKYLTDHAAMESLFSLM